MTQTTFSVAAGADDGYIEAWNAFYPPTTQDPPDTTTANVVLGRGGFVTPNSVWSIRRSLSRS